MCRCESVLMQAAGTVPVWLTTKPKGCWAHPKFKKNSSKIVKSLVCVQGTVCVSLISEHTRGSLRACWVCSETRYQAEICLEAHVPVACGHVKFSCRTESQGSGVNLVLRLVPKVALWMAPRGESIALGAEMRVAGDGVVDHFVNRTDSLTRVDLSLHLFSGWNYTRCSFFQKEFSSVILSLLRSASGL